MVKYCDIFWSFFKVGTFTIGGGYAMLPLMRREIVERHGWLDEEEFADQVALSQALPGVFAVNMAATTGYRLRRGAGAAVAIGGNIVMPIVFILAIAIGFRSVKDNAAVEHIFLGLRPAVVALVAAPVFQMARSARLTWSNGWIPVASALAVWLLGVSPIAVVLVAAVGGYLCSLLPHKD
ncbi:MAG: chromate transporter [Bacteroidales bacterium]|nr:chromate transporter [Bacteroidales bacterium]